MDIHYLALPICLYILCRFAQMFYACRDKLIAQTCIAFFFVVVMFLTWNIFASNRYDFEDWKSYGVSSETDIVKELGIEEDGILKK